MGVETEHVVWPLIFNAPEEPLFFTDEELAYMQRDPNKRQLYWSALLALRHGRVSLVQFNQMVRQNVFGSEREPLPQELAGNGGTIMALFRVTQFFTGGKYGWSESYYRTANSFDEVPPLAVTLGERRRACLTQQFALEAYRISQEGIFRDAKVFLVDPGAGVGLYPATSLTAGEAFLALLCRFEATQLHRRQLYLRGIPSEVVDPYGTYVQVGAFNIAISAFFSLLRSSPWQIRIPDPVQTPVNITGLTVRNVDPRFLDIVVDPPIPGAIIGQTYKVLRVSSPKGAAKTWRLASIAGAGAQLGLGPNKVPLVGDWSGRGTLTGQYLFIGSNITGTDVVRGVRRDTGRPFSSPVGRRRG
jgi:hypothetical protein